MFACLGKDTPGPREQERVRLQRAVRVRQAGHVRRPPAQDSASVRPDRQLHGLFQRPRGMCVSFHLRNNILSYLVETNSDIRSFKL